MGDLSERLEWRPAVVIDEKSASGQVAISSARVAGSSRSPRISPTLTPVASRSSRPVAGQRIRIAAIEDDCASGFRQRPRAGAAQALARRAHDRFAARDSEVHSSRSPLSTLPSSTTISASRAPRHRSDTKIVQRVLVCSPPREEARCRSPTRSTVTGRFSCRICTWGRAAAKPILSWICCAMSRLTRSIWWATSSTAGASAPAGTGRKLITTWSRSSCARSVAAREWCSFPATTTSSRASSSA